MALSFTGRKTARLKAVSGSSRVSGGRPGERLEGAAGPRRARGGRPSYSRVPGLSSPSPGLPLDHQEIKPH